MTGSEVDRLVGHLRVACPVAGVAVGTFGTPASVRIDYGDGATLAQRKAAIDALAAFDWSAATQQTWERNRTAVAAIALMATSYEPLSFTDRVISDALWTALNDVREYTAALRAEVAALRLAAGLPVRTPAELPVLGRVLKPEIVTRLIASAMTGGGDPATVPGGP